MNSRLRNICLKSVGCIQESGSLIVIKTWRKSGLCLDVPDLCDHEIQYLNAKGEDNNSENADTLL